MIRSYQTAQRRGLIASWREVIARMPGAGADFAKGMASCAMCLFAVAFFIAVAG